MTTSKFYTNKRKTYIDFNGEFFQASSYFFKNGPSAFTPIPSEDVHTRTIGGTWHEIEGNSIDEVYENIAKIYTARKEVTALKLADMQNKIDADNAAEDLKIQNLLANQPIESTVENVRLVLRHLNSTNWGGWNLPSMTIGYSAAQHSCDGKTVTTMKLDSGISDDFFTNERMFKSSCPRGFLEKYNRL